MEEQKNKKNHWSQVKVDSATKKINQEIYKRNRQAPLHIKLDDLSVFINDKITRRGISKGLVSIQEDINKNILKVEKKTTEALLTINSEKQYECLIEAKKLIKIEVWTDIMKVIAPPEIGIIKREQ